MTARLVFVYNAKAGFLAAAMDSIHKTLSPDTYACDLCALTHGIFTMRPQWREFLKQLPFEADFYHRPDFRLAFPEFADEPLPLVGILEAGIFRILLDAEVLRQFQDADTLVSAMQAKFLPD